MVEVGGGFFSRYVEILCLNVTPQESSERQMGVRTILLHLQVHHGSKTASGAHLNLLLLVVDRIYDLILLTWVILLNGG